MEKGHTVELQKRVNTWVWHVLCGFNKKPQDAPIGNLAIEYIVGRFFMLRLGVVGTGVGEYTALRMAIQEEFLIHSDGLKSNRHHTMEGQSNFLWTRPLCAMVNFHIKEFCKDVPMVRYHPSMRHDKVASKLRKLDHNEGYMVASEDFQLADRSAVGTNTRQAAATEAAAKLPVPALIDKRTSVRQAMLNHLNAHHRGALNGLERRKETLYAELPDDAIYFEMPALTAPPNGAESETESDGGIVLDDHED